MAKLFKPTYYDGVAKKAVEVLTVINDRRSMAGTPYSNENCGRFAELYASFGKGYQDPSKENSLGKALQGIADLRRARRITADTVATALAQLVAGIRRADPDYRFKEEGTHHDWETLAIALAGSLGNEKRGSEPSGGTCAVREELDLQGFL